MIRTLFASKKAEPSYPTLPEVSARGESNIKGLYLAGEVAGTPLVKLGLNEGHRLAHRIAEDLNDPNATSLQPVDYDLVIVGSGSSGLGAAIAAKDLGLRVVVLEATHFANTFQTMMKGKWLFAEPHDAPNESRVWFEECTREELLQRWQAMVRDERLDVRCHQKVEDIQGQRDAFEVHTSRGTYSTRRVLLAIGKSGNPRKLGVPGESEHAERISHRLLDAADHRDQHIVIIGAGDVAAEAAIALSAHNRVTLTSIDKELTYPKKRNIDKLRELEANGRLSIRLDSRVVEFRSSTIILESPRGREEVPWDHGFEMIGAELPLSFFKRVGIRLEDHWSPRKWIALVALFATVYLLYAWKKAFPLDPSSDVYQPDQASFPLNHFYPLLDRGTVLNLVRPLGFDPSFWYSLAYTVVMLVFGILAARRWNTRHQTLRYASLVAFQVAFFLIVNLAAPRIVGESQAWRAWGLYQPFPLFYNTFYWFTDAIAPWIAYFFVGFGLFLTLVFMPIMARYQGKRFCTWICGCGGLAETLGDRWRHLSPKGDRSRAWEFQNLVILAWVGAAIVLTFTLWDGDASNTLSSLYAYIVDFWLVAVIPIALYPFFGGKVWCRYWCPLAAYNQVLSRLFGRLKIVSNDKCITCTQCSKFCQVGVDVMAFAKNGEAFDNSVSSCIQCGICIDVCPMDVLSFESSSDTVQKRKKLGLPTEGSLSNRG